MSSAKWLSFWGAQLSSKTVLVFADILPTVSDRCRNKGPWDAPKSLLIHWWTHTSSQWRYDERDGVSNHRRFDCLLNRSFRYRSKKTPHVTGFCEGIHGWPVFPSQRASNAENVSIRWRHHDPAHISQRARTEPKLVHCWGAYSRSWPTKGRYGLFMEPFVYIFRALFLLINLLTCVNKLDRHLFSWCPDQSQAIIWTNAAVLVIGSLGTSFVATWLEINNLRVRKWITECCQQNAGRFLSASIR